MLSVFAKQEVRRLIQETKHNLTIDDFDDLEKLNRICLSIVDPKSDHNDLINMPISVGGYELTQPSVGALEWYNSFYLPIFLDRPLLADAGLAYVMHYARTPEDIWKLNTKRTASKAVKGFLRKISCTHTELQTSLREVLKISEDAGSKSSNENSLGRCIAMLVKEYGNSPDYWLWKAPLGIVDAFINDYVSRVEAETEAMRRSAQGASKPAPAASRIAKFEDLREHCNYMRDKWQKM